MQVNINLLPQKKPSKSAGRKLMIILLSVFILGIAGIVTTKVITVMEISELEAQVGLLQDERSDFESKQSENIANDDEMLSEINQLVSTRVATTEVMDEMVMPLQNGTVMSITYAESGIATIVTKVTQLEDIASYQKNLLQSEGIDEVTIVKVSKKQQELEQLASLIDGDSVVPPAETNDVSKEYFAELQLSFNPDVFIRKGGDE